MVRSALRAGYTAAGVFAMAPAARAEIEALLGAIRHQTGCPAWTSTAFGPAPAVAPLAYECLGAWYSRLDPQSKARALADVAARGLLCAPNPPWAACPHVRGLTGPKDLWEGAAQRGELAPGAEACAGPRQRISYLPMRGKEMLELFRLAGGALPPQLAEAARFGAQFLDRDFLIGVEARPPDPRLGAELARALDLLAVARALIADIAIVWAPGKGASLRFLLEQPLDGGKLVALLTVMAPDLLPSMLPQLLPALIPPPSDPLWQVLFGTLGQVLRPQPTLMVTLDQAKRATERLRERLGRPPWLRGVGISKDAHGYFVKVNVAEAAGEVQVPEKVLDVRVKVHEVGEIEAATTTASLRGFGQSDQPGTPARTGVDVVDRPGASLPTEPPPIGGVSRGAFSPLVIGIGATVLALAIVVLTLKGRS